MFYPRASARFATLLLSLSLAAWPVLASDNPGAHQHGHADLQMAIDNERVDLLLLSPAYNLIGFEHKPRTDEQQQRVNDTEQWASETAMINTVAGNCTWSPAPCTWAGVKRKATATSMTMVTPIAIAIVTIMTTTMTTTPVTQTSKLPRRSTARIYRSPLSSKPA